MGIHTGGPAAEHRSSRVFPTAGLAVASTSPKTDRSLPANVPALATARAVSNRQALLASSSVLPDSAPDPEPSAVDRSSVRVAPRTAPDAISLRTWNTPWLALRRRPGVEPNRSWSVLVCSRWRSHGESEPRPGRSLLRPACAGVRVLYASLRQPSGSARRSSAAHPASRLPATEHSVLPNSLPAAPAPDGCGENNHLRPPRRPSHVLLPANKTPMKNPSVTGRP